jgi:hypothetical protein
MKRFAVLVTFVILTTLSTNWLWAIFGWPVLYQVLFILVVAAVGEHKISSKGYYHYTTTDYNGPFVRNVPVWIMYLWVFSIQCSFLIPLALGFHAPAACMISGALCFTADIAIIEPLLSRVVNLWTWTPVQKGYFSFLPRRLNRFTAPPGNYLVWLGFPVVANGLMIFLRLLIA